MFLILHSKIFLIPFLISLKFHQIQTSSTSFNCVGGGRGGITTTLCVQDFSVSPPVWECPSSSTDPLREAEGCERDSAGDYWCCPEYCPDGVTMIYYKQATNPAGQVLGPTPTCIGAGVCPSNSSQECSQPNPPDGRWFCCPIANGGLTNLPSGGGQCEDIGGEDCLLKDFLCNNTLYFDLMTWQCPLTCNRCPPDNSQPTRPPNIADAPLPSQNCRDMLESATPPPNPQSPIFKLSGVEKEWILPECLLFNGHQGRDVPPLLPAGMCPPKCANPLFECQHNAPIPLILFPIFHSINYSIVMNHWRGGVNCCLEMAPRGNVLHSSPIQIFFPEYIFMDDYYEGQLAGRRIWWCPGGQGYLAYCPQPIDPDGYNFCCTYYHLGVDKPTCCLFPLHTGVLISLFLGFGVLLFLFLFFTCWFCPICPLANRLVQN